MGKNKLILISGAISGSRFGEDITKIEGRSLILQEKRTVTSEEWKDMVLHITRIFKNKPKLMYPLLAQIYDSDHTVELNLTEKQIKNLTANSDGIILWEGSSDYAILNYLGIKQRIFTLKGWDVLQNGTFHLQLIDMLTKDIIVSHQIGKFNKQGRALNLTEAHNMCCDRIHTITHPHDPRTDVIWTKCLFNMLFKYYQKTINKLITINS